MSGRAWGVKCKSIKVQEVEDTGMGSGRFWPTVPTDQTDDLLGDELIINQTFIIAHENINLLKTLIFKF